MKSPFFSLRPSATRLLIALITFASLGLGSARATEPSRREYIDPRSNVGDPRAFSAAVRVGDTLYLSGHIALTPAKKVPDTAEGEARLLLDQFQATLASAGMTMDDLVMVQILCSDLSLYGTFNQIYRTYFKQEFPARAFLGTNQLLYNARFEILGVAVKR
ncbi:MAG: hypothetical protein RL376_1839 [Verrucomicrobiota bacterium]|jgi:enamine deaminase RidA (YjgF/YER057c/UK114 family)